ncbi:MAG: hypothetical protein D4R73_02315 [Deltaproteobacteria bacterium]|jgi:hypothetical protein|nr:hypothetical protein [Deltaproteobacteria bacterium]MDQ7838335.1 hypothetical protein [Thermodesulfobacteriota bacterium]TSA12428.1 MAG: hypothetical protein D4R73_02315 [Deltaproteobacteria bacterium]
MNICKKVFLIVTMALLLTSCAWLTQKASIPRPEPLPALPKRPPVNFRIEGTTAYVSVDEMKALMKYVLDLEERNKAADRELRKIREALQ